MSHIQKILERAERDGAIRPSALPVLPDPPPYASAAAVVEPAFPIAPIEAPPAPSARAVRVVAGRLHPTLAEALRPESASAEQYRSLRTRLQQSANGRGIHVILVTSPTRGEGRTHTAASLALSMTQEHGRRVCLVDANLRGAQLRSRFGLPDGPTLGDVLAERATLEDALIHVEGYNITVLPGADTNTHSELLGSTAMRRVMQALRAQFDRILIDAPPANPVADVALLTPMVDGLVLVVRAGVTSKPVIRDTIAGIDGDKLLGVVLNDAR